MSNNGNCGCSSNLISLLAFAGGAASGYAKAQGIELSSKESVNNVILYGAPVLGVASSTLAGMIEGGLGGAGCGFSVAEDISDKFSSSVAGAVGGCTTGMVGGGILAGGCTALSLGIVTGAGYLSGYVIGKML